MTLTDNRPETTVPNRAPGRSAVRAVASSGWLPAGFVGLLAVVTLHYTGVGTVDMVTFAAYVLGAVVVPGTLVWRAARGRAADLVTDVAAGTAIGYALEVAAYLPARAAGVPPLALVVPAGIVVAFAAVPRLRRFWRGSGERVPTWWAWVLSLFAAFVLAWAVATFFPAHGLTWPGNANPYVDMPYQLALAAELKHHVPPVTPYVAGTGLKYHWFVHAELAATSWATGIELQTLLYRLSLLPMQVAFVTLIAVAGRRLVGRWWAGPVAAAVAFFVVIPSPYRWLQSPFTEGSVLATIWLSPTQTFGAMLFVPVVIVLAELLRGEETSGRAGRWALLGLLLGVLTGAKATFLPIVLCALLVVVVGRWLATRTVSVPALAAAGMALAAFAFAQLVLFRGSSSGLEAAPWRTIRDAPLATETGLSAPGVAATAAVAVVVLCLVFWAFTWPGAFGLFARGGRGADPANLLCLGIAAAAVGVVVVFTHPAGGQVYFFQAARPYLGILVAAGLAAVVPAVRARVAPTVALVLALGAGALTMWLFLLNGPRSAPTEEADGIWGVLGELALPLAVLAAVAGLVGLTVRLVARWRPALRGLALAVVLLFLTGTVIPGSIQRYEPAVTAALTEGANVPFEQPKSGPWLLDRGSVVAARWLRDHSAPDDLVATNVHCRVVQQEVCESRHFWISAYTERRVLVEGWNYTDRAYEIYQRQGGLLYFVPFWDPALLTANDEAFQQPSEATVGRLRDTYGVRWLYVDRRRSAPAVTLPDFAALRFRAGNIDVYEL